ncbi:hypothetical protein [Desulforamulus reducens]|uniref:hypothetical protein n=1 Tax=Desulforamulus reducens TaxID=59610 RepID=UPI0012E9D3AF|nr:hypothetical protein [Desulforamulus reducens]
MIINLLVVRLTNVGIVGVDQKIEHHCTSSLCTCGPVKKYLLVLCLGCRNKEDQNWFLQL